MIIMVDMDDKELLWKKISQEKILETKVCDIYSQKEVQDNGQIGDYVSISAPEWVLIVAKKDDKFIMVKQFRHAYQDITIEFPGGVVDKGEYPFNTAKRELLEETGYKANKLTLLACLSPNPAIMSNKVYFYLAEDLYQTGNQHLDSDEYLNFIEVPINEVINSFGQKPYVHAFIGTGIMLYQRYLASK